MLVYHNLHHDELTLVKSAVYKRIISIIDTDILLQCCFTHNHLPDDCLPSIPYSLSKSWYHYICAYPLFISSYFLFNENKDECITC